MEKKKTFINLCNSFLIIAIIFTVYDLKRPSCVEAQSCIRIKPNIVYGSSGYRSAKKCGSTTVTRFMGQVGGMPWVALTGWRLNYTSSDHHIDQMSTRIGTVQNVGNTTVSFAIGACLNDDNNDDSFAWEAEYVIVAWL